MTAAEKSKTDPNITIENLRLGVWTLKIGKTSGHKLFQWWTDIKSLPLFYRLCSDIFSLAPRLFTFFVLCVIWQGLEEALLMHFSSLLLRRVCHDWLYSHRGLLFQYTGSRSRKVFSQENPMLQLFYPQQQSSLRVRF